MQVDSSTTGGYINCLFLLLSSRPTHTITIQQWTGRLSVINYCSDCGHNKVLSKTGQADHSISIPSVFELHHFNLQQRSLLYILLELFNTEQPGVPLCTLLVLFHILNHGAPLYV